MNLVDMLMDPFRLSLLVAGLVVIVGIYAWGRWRRSKAEQDVFLAADESSDVAQNNPDDWDVIPLPRQAERDTPMEEVQLKELAGFSGQPAKGGLTAEEEMAAAKLFGAEETAESAAPPAPAVSARAPEPKPQPKPQSAPEDTLLVITLIAQPGAFFSGPTLSDVFESLGLEYGQMKIFHRFAQGDTEPVFSITNILEPGYFELSSLPDLQTPGLALFMPLPGPLPGRQAFADFLTTAQRLASSLEGRLADQQRRALNEDAIAQMRQIAERYDARAQRVATEQ